MVEVGKSVKSAGEAVGEVGAKVVEKGTEAGAATLEALGLDDNYYQGDGTEGSQGTGESMGTTVHVRGVVQ